MCDIFGLYATRTDSIEEFIDCLARSPDPNDSSTQHCLMVKCGLTDLSPSEISYIEQEVNKRR